MQLKNGQKAWNALKSGKRIKIEDRSKIEAEIDSLNRKAKEINTQKKLFWFKSFKIASQETENEVIIENIAKSLSQSTTTITVVEDMPQPGKDVVSDNNKTVLRERPVEERLTKQINELNDDLVKLNDAKNLKLVDNNLIKNQISDARKLLEKAKKKLKRLKYDRIKKVEYRQKQKRLMKKIAERNPEYAEALKPFIHEQIGRPRIESEQPLLLKTIMDIAIIGSSTDERRRSEMMRSCKTLDDLTESLKERGFNISRTATYLRLLPRRSLSNEGKRHVHTVPVRLKKPEYVARKYHSDRFFAAASINLIKELLVLFGPINCFFLSRDDKAKVTLGLPVANKQSPVLLHLEYVIKLPDHDFTPAPKHKLCPSVYGACVIDDSKITYSGPTYVAIRSAKHCKSNAQTHAIDFEKLITLEPFKELLLDENGLLKAIGAFSVDGGPDQNPRYPAVVNAAVRQFLDNDMDALFVMTNAPHHSAYNPVERRMAPLSHDVSGLILKHDSYGSHLNSKGETIDRELELKNFEKAGQTLAEVWSNTVIDGYPVIAEYVVPKELMKDEEPNERWKFSHIRQSQYLTQIVRCDDRSCCKQWRTNYFNVFKDRFIPGPVPYERTKNGVESIDRSKAVDNLKAFPSLFQRLILPQPVVDMPFDWYCPSLQKEIEKRICKTCKNYFVSQKSLQKHQVIHRSVFPAVGHVIEKFHDSQENIEEVISDEDNTNQIYIIPGNEFNDWISSPFIECDNNE
jgi:hypothetical protein